MKCLRLLWFVAVAGFTLACQDRGITPPRDGTGLELANAQPANLIPVIKDWYDCSSGDQGNSWYCEYTHTDTSYTTGGNLWDANRFRTYKKCEVYAQYCDDQFTGYSGFNNPQRDHLDTDEPSQDPTLNLAKPTCSVASTVTNKYHRAYCAGKNANPLTSTQLARVSSAISAMRQVGGWCGQLADAADAVFGRGDLQFFPRSNYTFGGAAPTGGGTSGNFSWAVIDRTFITKFYDNAHQSPSRENPFGLTLRAAIAHEMDHLLGQSHVEYDDNGDGTIDRTSKELTPYTVVCGGLD